MTENELLKAVAEQLEKNSTLVGELTAKINSIEKKVKEIAEQQEMFTEHFNRNCNAAPAEKASGIMSDAQDRDTVEGEPAVDEKD